MLRVSAVDGTLTIEADGARLIGRPVGPDAFVVDPRGTEQYLRFLMEDAHRARAIAYRLRIIARTAER